MRNVSLLGPEALQVAFDHDLRMQAHIRRQLQRAPAQSIADDARSSPIRAAVVQRLRSIAKQEFHGDPLGQHLQLEGLEVPWEIRLAGRKEDAAAQLGRYHVLSDRAEPVGRLIEIFSYFDSLVDKYGLDKIRTGRSSSCWGP